MQRFVVSQVKSIWTGFTVSWWVVGGGRGLQRTFMLHIIGSPSPMFMSMSSIFSGDNILVLVVSTRSYVNGMNCHTLSKVNASWR